MSNRAGGSTTHHTGRGGRGRGHGRGNEPTRTLSGAKDTQGSERAATRGLVILTETIIKPESGYREEISAVGDIRRLSWPDNPQTEKNTVEVKDSEDEEEQVKEEEGVESMSMDGSGTSDNVELVGVKPPEPKERRWQDDFDTDDDDEDEEMEDRSIEVIDGRVQTEADVAGKGATKTKRKQDDMKQHSTQKVSPDKLKTPKREGKYGGNEEEGGKENNSKTGTTGIEKAQTQDTKKANQNEKDKPKTPARDKPRVTNPYKTPTYNTPTRKNKDELKTPTKENGRALNYAAVLKSQQTKLITHEKTKEAYDGFYEVVFNAYNIGERTPQEAITARLQEVMRAILTRAKEVDRKAKINTWAEIENYPTVAKTEDIPDDFFVIKKYLAPDSKNRSVIQGRNSGWRVRITTHIPMGEFEHYWSSSKKSFDKVEFITLRKAPLQNETYYAAGFLLNSSDGQLVGELEEHLTRDIGFPIGISHKPAALDKKAANELWQEAKKARAEAPKHEKSKVFFRNAPLAQQIYAATRQEAHQAAIYMTENYGTTDQDGQYPMLPDGARMRFLPAGVFLDMQGRATAATLFPQQIQFQNMEVVASIPIRDPRQKFPTQENRTMQQLVLDLKDPEMADEPYFRHIKRRFHWNYKVKEYEVSIHGQMYARAAGILRHFKLHMTEKYGPEVGDAIMDQDTAAEFDRSTVTSREGGMSGISIATEDRYLNGSAKFIITGLEKVHSEGKEKTLRDIRNTEDDEHTLNLRSMASGITGQTETTMPTSIRQNMVKSTTDTQGTKATRDSEEWTRCGTPEAEERRAKTITQTPDPREEQRGQYP